MGKTAVPRSEGDRESHIMAILPRLIERGTARQYHLFFQKYHEADIAHSLEQLPEDQQLRFFNRVNPELGVDVLEEMKMGQQLMLIGDFKTDLAAKFIHEMEPDDAADLIEELYEQDEELAEEIIEALPEEDAQEIKELLTYPDNTAGSIMTSQYVWIPENLTVTQAQESLREKELPEDETAFYIFIVSKIGRLVGYTTLRDFFVHSGDTLIKDIRTDYPISIDALMDQEEVARLFQKYDVSVLPVVDDRHILKGVITVDDIVDVVVEEATEDIYKLSGTSEVSEEKLLSGNIVYSIRSRLPWLLLTILGGIIASYIIEYYAGNFNSSLISLSLSLSFVPLLMGLGGNVGNQSATIIVRGLSTGVVDRTESVRFIGRELAVGGLIGAIIALVLFVFGVVSVFPVVFSLIISISMAVNIIVAALVGSALPLIFVRFNIDPAVASAPFISSALDIVGQLIYFGMTLGILSVFL